MHDEQQIFELIPILEAYPFSKLIFHPRKADQLYKGTPNRQLFARFSNSIKQPVVYNRITSYNVCYTKLLRDSKASCAVPD